MESSLSSTTILSNLPVPVNTLLRWIDDPIAFVREEFGIEPDDWQAEFLMAYVTGQRVAAKACKGPGTAA